MKYCVVPSCKYHCGTEENVKMFRFPRNNDIAREWTKVIKQVDFCEKPIGGMVCIEHFTEKDFKRNDKHKSQLKPESIPTIFNEQNMNEFDASAININVDNVDIGCSNNNHCVHEHQLNTIKEENDDLIKMDQTKSRTIDELRKTIKSLRDKLYYLEGVNSKLKETTASLKEHNTHNEKFTEELKAIKNNELLLLLHSGKKGGLKYSEKARQFCLTLHYYSPRAYQFVRESFQNHLPHTKTIQSWYACSDINGEPGILPAHMAKLEKIATTFEDQSGSKILCSLVTDEMSIRTQVFWSLHEEDYIGFVSYGENPQKKEKTIAKQVILYILNGLNLNLEFPVAYFFINSLNAEQRKNLLLEIIKAVTKCGVIITNLTFDGYAANIPMCQSLGANLDLFSPNIRTYFTNPYNGLKIHIIMDPCHMEKLARNALASKEIFYDGTNEKIEWKYIVKLYEFSKQTYFPMHKLSKKHIQWDRNQMNVRLSVQTLSESVAKSLEILMNQGHPDFAGAAATIKFVRTMNTLFDIFNTKHTNNQDIFKRALNRENRRVVEDFFASCKKYFESLKILEERNVGGNKRMELILLMKSRRKTAFNGFIINMMSVISMYEQLVEKETVLDSLPTYYLLQDVIEMLFGKIRACCGFNNNPNVHQFKGAYRKIQANLNIKCSEHSNCRIFDYNLPNLSFSNLSFSNVYFVSSKRPTIQDVDCEDLYVAQKHDILSEVAFLDKIESNPLLDTTKQISILHIVAMIEKKIISCPRFYCSSCQVVLQENEKVSSIDSKFLGWIPCVSSYEICKNAEKYFKLYDIRSNSKSRFDFKVLYCMMFRSMNFNSLYTKSKFDCDINHKYQLIKCMVGQYVAIRAAQVSRDITLDQYNLISRHHFNRLVITDGQ